MWLAFQLFVGQTISHFSFFVQRTKNELVVIGGFCYFHA